MTHDLIRRMENLGSPRIVVVGDLILDRYIWGYAERISQEAPVPLLRADQREHRLGGAASVATMLRALGAQVRLIGGVGHDPEASLVRQMLEEHEIDDRWVVSLDDRPTTLKERYIGRAQDRHPQQMIRVDYETRDPIPAMVEARLHAELPAALEWADVVLISDYGKGVCTPSSAPRGHRHGAVERCQGAGRPDPIVGLWALPRRPLHDPQSSRGPARDRHVDRASPKMRCESARNSSRRSRWRPSWSRSTATAWPWFAPTAEPSCCPPAPARSTTSPGPATWCSRSSACASPAGPTTTKPPRSATSPAGSRSRSSASRS